MCFKQSVVVMCVTVGGVVVWDVVVQGMALVSVGAYPKKMQVNIFIGVVNVSGINS